MRTIVEADRRCVVPWWSRENKTTCTPENTKYASITVKIRDTSFMASLNGHNMNMD
jgi:hypothetical protein